MEGVLDFHLTGMKRLREEDTVSVCDVDRYGPPAKCRALNDGSSQAIPPKGLEDKKIALDQVHCTIEPVEVQPVADRKEKFLTPVEGIHGLFIGYNWISEEEEKKLLEAVDAETWDATSLKRRVQQYGYVYDYKNQSVSASNYLGDLPEWCNGVKQSLTQPIPLDPSISREKLSLEAYDQMIVNEYLPGQGIGAHTDHEYHFGESVVSLSLGSDIVMNFTNKYKTHEVVLPRRSIVVLVANARYTWQHAIVARKFDKIGGIRTARKRRVSLTFRKVRKTLAK